MSSDSRIYIQKFKLFYIMVSLFAASSTFAQSFEYGIKIGVPISDISITNMPDTHINSDKPEIWKHYFYSKVGINVSLIGGYCLSSKIYIGIEPGYILKGANFDASESKLDLHYWNLPVILKYRISDRLGICFGPEFSKLITAELDFDGRIINMDSFYDKVEASALFGVEYQAIKYFRLGIRYNYGFTKVSETNWFDESGNIYNSCKENNYYLLMYATLSIR